VPDGWTWLIVATFPTVAIELFLLHGIRRSWPPPGRRSAPAGGAHETPSVESPPLHSAAVLCFEPGGLCTAANSAGRRLLAQRQGETTLGHLLCGGDRSAASLLKAVAAQGVLERDEAIVSAPELAAVHLRAVALRDRDNNFWGAALVIPP